MSQLPPIQEIVVPPHAEEGDALSEDLLAPSQQPQVQEPLSQLTTVPGTELQDFRMAQNKEPSLPSDGDGNFSPTEDASDESSVVSY